MPRYKLIVHRRTLLHEVWYVNGTSSQDARAQFENGDADFQWQEDLDSEDAEVQSVEQLPSADPDVDMDDGL